MRIFSEKRGGKEGQRERGGSSVFCVDQRMQAHFQVTETDYKGISASPTQSSKLATWQRHFVKPVLYLQHAVNKLQLQDFSCNCLIEQIVANPGEPMFGC